MCSIQALEPDEECPVHGIGEWPPRCVYCGQYMKQGEERECSRRLLPQVS